MNIDEAMAQIALEAEQQGFQVRQTRTGIWRISKDNQHYFLKPTDVDDLLSVLSVLIAAGLDWSHHWD